LKRATISLHISKKERHLDLFLEPKTEGDLLKTYESEYESWDILQKGGIIELNLKEDHRDLYLDYEGEISGNRGSIVILWKGRYSAPENFDKKINVRKENELLVFI